MNIQELREWVKRRLTRKAKQAERAFISEFTVKSTTNCLNHGIQLGENIWNCKIGAMGLHENGASQCWNNKARVCPLFELKRDVEKLKSDFRKMNPNELAIRWPSIGELIRFDCMLSMVDEFGDENHEENARSEVHQSGDQLLSSEDETGIGSDDEDVRRERGPGHSDSTSSNQAGIDTNWVPDPRGSIFGSSDSTGLSMAALAESRDRRSSDRETL
jgi:hypothetical protein